MTESPDGEGRPDDPPELGPAADAGVRPPAPPRIYFPLPRDPHPVAADVVAGADGGVPSGPDDAGDFTDAVPSQSGAVPRMYRPLRSHRTGEPPSWETLGGGEELRRGLAGYSLPPHLADEQAPVPARSKRSTLITLALVLVVGIGVVLYFVLRHTGLDARVGDCVSIGATTSTVAVVDCSAPQAQSKVSAIEPGAGATCTDPDTDYTVGRSGSNSDQRWCLQLVLREGECITDHSTHVDCSTQGGTTFRIVALLDGTTDKTRCPAGTTARIYAAANRMYCDEPA